MEASSSESREKLQADVKKLVSAKQGIDSEKITERKVLNTTCNTLEFMCTFIEKFNIVIGAPGT